MKTIGLIGGMSWESSSIYYQLINKGIREKLGKSHSAKIILYSVDFEEIARLQHQNNWAKLTDMMIAAAQTLEAAGADCIVLCTNTMHKLAPEISSKIFIPFLHIADAIGEALIDHKVHKAVLLGTKFTMEENFYKEKLIHDYNIDIHIPSDEERAVVHEIIYSELVRGIVTSQSRDQYLKIVRRFQNNNINCFILGCTEIGLILTSEYSDALLMDSTYLHSQFAINFALS
jgi:aspartate racemase